MNTWEGIKAACVVIVVAMVSAIAADAIHKWTKKPVGVVEEAAPAINLDEVFPPMGQE
jgi:hypothetical protein